MLNKNRNKLTEEFLQVQINEIDGIFLQEEFEEMQDTITEIIQQLPFVDESRIEIIHQLLQISNNVIDQINANVNIQELKV